MVNCGLDCHEESIRICLLDAKGRRILEETVSTESTDLEALLGPYVKRGLRIALEASGVSFAIHDRMSALGAEVQIWPPSKIRVIAESKAKSDKNDARTLAGLLHSGFHPRAVYVPTDREREIRNLLVTRQSLIRSRVRVGQSARSLLVKAGRKLPLRTFRSGRGWKRVCEEAAVSESNRFVLVEMRDTWIEHDKRIKRFDAMLGAIAESAPETRYLQTMPGVGPLTALFMAVGIGNATRFDASREIGSYLGVVPTCSDSAKVKKRGHITKEGKPELRAMWIQAANAFLLSRRSAGQSLREWFDKCSKRRGRKIAIVALSRKLMVIAWHIMKEKRPYRPEYRLEEAA